MKVKLHIKLDSEDKIDIKVSGIKKNNSYTYLENDIKVSIYYSDSDISINKKKASKDKTRGSLCIFKKYA